MSAKTQVEKTKNEVRSFAKDFKTFISRGNVVDMAVGVVIGSSFGKIVSGLVSDIITPAISFLTGGKSVLSALKTVIVPAVTDAETGEIVTAEVAIMWGNWLQTILDFLITAFFVFLFLRILTKGRSLLEAEKKRKEAEAAAKAAAAAKEKAEAEAAHQQAIDDSILAQKELLTEIRNILQQKAQ